MPSYVVLLVVGWLVGCSGGSEDQTLVLRHADSISQAVDFCQEAVLRSVSQEPSPAPPPAPFLGFIALR